MRVHVVADAEAEHAHVALAGARDICHDVVLARVAHGRASVREEDDEVRPVTFLGPQRERLLQRVINGRAAERLQILDERLRLRAAFLRDLHHLVEERLDLRGETQHLEAVAVVQVLHAERQRLLRLLQLRARHRSRCIEHEHHVLRNHLRVLRVRTRRREQQEVTVLTARPVGQQIQPDVILLLREENLKVRVRLHVARLVSDHRLVPAAALDLHLVAGRIDRLERALRFQIELDAHVLHRLRGELVRVQRQDEVHQPGVGLEQLRVGERDAFPAVRLDGEDADLEQIAPGVFEQRGILEPAHDVLVDAARLVRGQQLGLDLFAADFHGELVDVRALGRGKQERAFQLARVRIVKLLLHLRHGDLVFDLNVHLVERDLHRRPHGLWRRTIRRRPRDGNRVRRQDAPVTAPEISVMNDDQPGGQSRQRRRRPHQQKPDDSFHTKDWTEGAA